jgi:hypothetical protein
MRGNALPSTDEATRSSARAPRSVSSGNRRSGAFFFEPPRRAQHRRSALLEPMSFLGSVRIGARRRFHVWRRTAPEDAWRPQRTAPNKPAYALELAWAPGSSCHLLFGGCEGVAEGLIRIFLPCLAIPRSLEIIPMPLRYNTKLSHFYGVSRENFALYSSGTTRFRAQHPLRATNDSSPLDDGSARLNPATAKTARAGECPRARSRFRSQPAPSRTRVPRTSRAPFPTRRGGSGRRGARGASLRTALRWIEEATTLRSR